MISEVKQEAKKSLQGKWGMAIATFIIASLLMGLLGSTGIGALLLSSILSIGVFAVFQNGMNDEFKLEDLFVGFKENVVQRIILSVLKTLFIALWSLLFIIPGIIKSYAWAMAEYISLKNPDYDYDKCLKESARLMKGHKFEYFLFQLSFIGWIILSIFTFGLLLILYVGPYMQAAQIKYFEKIYGDANVCECHCGCECHCEENGEKVESEEAK